MHPSLGRAFEQLERQKIGLLADIAGLSDEQLRFKPDEAAWSTLCVMDHLVRVEDSFIATAKRHTRSARPVSLRERFGAVMVNAVMRSPMRVKVPATAASVLPQDGADFATLTARWQAVQERMAALLASLKEEQLGSGVFHHPVAGWMTARGGVAFLSAHLRHHEYQLQRLRSAATATSVR